MGRKHQAGWGSTGGCKVTTEEGYLCFVSNRLSLPPASWQASQIVLSPVPDVYILG